MEESENSLFDGYWNEFSQLIQRYQSQSSPDDGTLKQCESLLQQMTMEARTASDAQEKTEQLDRVRACKSQLQAIKLESDRNSLLGSQKQRHSTKSSTEQVLERQNETLERARQSMEETEAVARETTQELQSNREAIESSQNKVKDISSMTDRAGQILKSMSKPWWRP